MEYLARWLRIPVLLDRRSGAVGPPGA